MVGIVRRRDLILSPIGYPTMRRGTIPAQHRAHHRTNRTLAMVGAAPQIRSEPLIPVAAAREPVVIRGFSLEMLRYAVSILRIERVRHYR